MIRKSLAAILLATLTISSPGSSWVRPAAALTVFDPTNFAQNLLQAIRAMEQINNQIQSLQNEATMLRNMARDLKSLDYSSLGKLTGALHRIDGLMLQAQGIAFDVDRTTAALRQQFPEDYDAATTTDRAVGEALTRWRSTMQAHRQTMTVQAQVIENVQADSETLADLVLASQGASGNLAAQQAGNQLIALSTKQQLQIQNLMAAQYRAEALEQARKAASEEEGRKATVRFLGTGKAYTPQ